MVCYIIEAHAVDEWPISSSRANGDRGIVEILQPRTDQDRCEVALGFKKDFMLEIPIIVDSINNDFDRLYSPWPLRFYTFQDRAIEFIAEPHEGRFDLSLLREALLH